MSINIFIFSLLVEWAMFRTSPKVGCRTAKASSLLFFSLRRWLRAMCLISRNNLTYIVWLQQWINDIVILYFATFNWRSFFLAVSSWDRSPSFVSVIFVAKTISLNVRAETYFERTNPRVIISYFIRENIHVSYIILNLKFWIF